MSVHNNYRMKMSIFLILSSNSLNYFQYVIHLTFNSRPGFVRPRFQVHEFVEVVIKKYIFTGPCPIYDLITNDDIDVETLKYRLIRVT